MAAAGHAESREHVEAEYGPDAAELLFTIHPQIALAGDYLECEDPEDTEPVAKPWYKFW